MSEVRKAVIFMPCSKGMDRELVQSLVTAERFPGLIDGHVVDIEHNEYRNPDGLYRYAIIANVDGDVYQSKTGLPIGDA